MALSKQNSENTMTTEEMVIFLVENESNNLELGAKVREYYHQTLKN